MVRIVNFGACNIDQVYTLDHIVTAGETSAAARYAAYPGGKGLILSIAAAKAGSTVYHAGLVGRDGGELINTLKKSGVDVSYMQVTEGNSGRSIIQVNSKGENSVFMYDGVNRSIRRDYIDEVLKWFYKNDILIVQNDINLVDYIVECGYKKGMKVVLIPSPINDELRKIDLSKITYLLLNNVEAEALTGMDDCEASVIYLQRSHPQLKILLTFGSKGCLYADGERRVYHPAYSVDIQDTTGAGTVFAGYFISCISAGNEINKALRYASAAAALSVSRAGASPSVPDKNDVETELLFLKPKTDENELKGRERVIAGYIDAHIKDAKLSELAEELGYSEVYASGLIKKLTGKTFSALLKDKRCDVCARLFRESDMAIEEIIRSVGYENDGFFRKIFKARYGITPLKYRKNKR